MIMRAVMRQARFSDQPPLFRASVKKPFRSDGAVAIYIKDEAVVNHIKI